MRDDRLNELLNAELDGELDGAGQVELERLLAASPEAKLRRDELRRVADALSHLKPVDPPPELREAVLAAFRPGAAKVVRFPAARVQRRWVPYAGALAAGVALGAIGLSLYYAPRDEFDAASLAGTMADPDHHSPGQVLDRVLFPTMARMQFDKPRLARTYLTGIAVCAAAILPLSAIVFILAREIVGILLGPAWSGVAEPLQVLAAAMLFRTSYKLGDSLARRRCAHQPANLESRDSDARLALRQRAGDLVHLLAHLERVPRLRRDLQLFQRIFQPPGVAA